jgi:hypothetical protein
MSIEVAAEGTAVLEELPAPWRLPPTWSVDMTVVKGNKREKKERWNAVKRATREIIC